MTAADKFVLVVSIAQARRIAKRLPDLRPQIQAELRQIAALDGVPRTVLYRDMGDGLTQAAVAFYDAPAADRAADALWQKTVRTARPVGRKPRKVVA